MTADAIADPLEDITVAESTTRRIPRPPGGSRSRLRPAALVVGLVMASAAALTACGSSGAATGGVSGIDAAPTGAAATAAPANQIVLSEYKVAMPATTVKAGAASFTITNSGAVEHEVLVFKSDLDAAQFPYDAGAAKFDEAGAGVTSVSDGENIPAGGNQTRTVTLTTPGRYLFVCNLPGHYKLGMFTAVTVTP